MRASEKKDRDGDCGDHNQQRIDATVQRRRVRVGFRRHEVERVLRGSGKGFKENPVNWQDNFAKTATNFCEKRKYLGMVSLHGERQLGRATSSWTNSQFCGAEEIVGQALSLAGNGQPGFRLVGAYPPACMP